MLLKYALGLLVGVLLAGVFLLVERVTRGRRSSWLRRRGLSVVA